MAVNPAPRMPGSMSAARAVAMGAASGLVFGAAALFAAFLSAGAGHGDYVAARALFPAPMLLTLLGLNGKALAMGLALLQFPLYGGAAGWSVIRQAYGPVILAGLLHVAATILCFGGALPAFS